MGKYLGKCKSVPGCTVTLNQLRVLEVRASWKAFRANNHTAMSALRESNLVWALVQGSAVQ
jgi:hypothetical protein